MYKMEVRRKEAEGSINIGKLQDTRRRPVYTTTTVHNVFPSLGILITPSLNISGVRRTCLVPDRQNAKIPLETSPCLSHAKNKSLNGVCDR